MIPCLLPSLLSHKVNPLVVGGVMHAPKPVSQPPLSPWTEVLAPALKVRNASPLPQNQVHGPQSITALCRMKSICHQVAGSSPRGDGSILGAQSPPHLLAGQTLGGGSKWQLQ